MSEVGALVVKLTAETAQFREDLGKVKSKLDNLNPAAKSAGSAVKTSMTDSRESVMLLGEEVGVHMPRALSMFVSKLPGVATLMESAFPIIGIVAVIGMVGKLIEKHQALEKAIRDENRATNEATIKGEDEAKSLTLTNMKLDDQIALLEHKPKKNYMAEELLQTSIAVDKLAASFTSDFNKMDDAIDKQVGWTARLERVWDDAWSGEGQSGKNGGYGHTTQQLWEVQHAVEGVSKAREAMARAPLTTDAQTAAEINLKNALLNQLNVTDAAIKANKQYKDVEAELENGAASTTTAINSLNLTLEANQKHAKIAGLEQNQSNQKSQLPELHNQSEGLRSQVELQKSITAGIEAHNQALIRLAHTQAETAAAATHSDSGASIGTKLAEKKAAIELERDTAIAASHASLAAKAADYRTDMKNAQASYAIEMKEAGDDSVKRAGLTQQLEAKKKELETQWANTVHATEDSIVQYNATANEKIVSAERTAANERADIEKGVQEAKTAGKQQLVQDSDLHKLQMDEEISRTRVALGKETMAQEEQDELSFNARSTQIQVNAINNKIADLDKGNKNYLKQLTEFENQKTEIIKKGEYQAAFIRLTAENNSALLIKQTWQQTSDAIAGDISTSIVMNQSLAAAFRKTGEEMAVQMIKNMILAEITGDKKKLVAAEGAAVDSFWWASSWGGPVAGMIAAAAAFAGVMSFETGGKIGGANMGSGGAVPILAHQGETVVTKALTDRVERAESGGNSVSGGTHHWNYAPQVHAVDAEGVDRVLQKHASVFQRHVTQTMRRMNH